MDGEGGGHAECRERRPLAARSQLEHRQGVEQERERDILGEVGPVEEAVEGQVARPDHVRRPEEDEQHGDGQPGCPRSGLTPCPDEHRMEQEDGDGDPDHGQERVEGSRVGGGGSGGVVVGGDHPPREAEQLQVGASVAGGDVRVVEERADRMERAVGEIAHDR